MSISSCADSLIHRRFFLYVYLLLCGLFDPQEALSPCLSPPAQTLWTHRRLFLQFWLLLCRLSNFPDASFKKTALFLTLPVSDKELKK